MTKDELIFLKDLLNMLRIKTKTDALYVNVQQGMKIVDRELELKKIEKEI